MSKTSFVYFIRLKGTGFLKIGKSKNPQRRLESLRTANPLECELVGSIPERGLNTELNFHSRFVDYHFRGEWFREVGGLQAFIKEEFPEAKVIPIPPGWAEHCAALGWDKPKVLSPPQPVGSNKDGHQ